MWIDTHCDVLWKLWDDSSISFSESDQLRIDWKKWGNSSLQTQGFALFVPDDVSSKDQFRVVEEMIEIFRNKVLTTSPNIKWVRNGKEIQELQPKEKGAFLALEGCHPIGNDIGLLKKLLDLGIIYVGLTWNQPNLVADGIGEPRGGGLTKFGEEVIQVINDYHGFVDVSHVSIQGFWDTMKFADFPIASHSNAKSISPHRRNLDDDQIKALIQKKGWIGVTFVPEFLTRDMSHQATKQDVLRNLEHICSLGGEEFVGFGSDFDGTSGYIKGLETPLGYDQFINELLQLYSENLVKGFIQNNFLQALSRAGK
ncbi:membrane dipeptidase [Bacillaceae bacterium S4-13-58]